MHRRRTSVLAVASLAVLLAAAPVSAAPGTSGFTGRWVSTDTDGSHQTLSVSAGATPTVVYQDFYARGCDTFGGPATHWVASGQGFIEGDQLLAAFHKSGCGAFLMGGYEDVFIYDAGTDTLEDSFGITWSRAR